MPHKVDPLLIGSLNEISKKLKLSANLTEYWADKADEEHLRFLLEVLQQEMLFKTDAKHSRLIKKAGFPSYKTFAGYTHDNVRLPPILKWQDIENASFVKEKKNLVLMGPVGTGKTHLATAIGIEACRQGMSTGFYTVTGLILKLAEARKKGQIERLSKQIKKLDLLILDEWGYVPIDLEGAQILFQIIADSYEQKSLILTTNIEFGRWGNMFTDDQMAAAMIDRLAHHGHLIMFEGNSYRMEHALMRQQVLA